MAAQQYFVIVCYDISKTKIRNKIIELLETYGVRVNYSVFECNLSKRQLTGLKEDCNKLIQPKTDRILIYVQCLNCLVKMEKLGNPGKYKGNLEQSGETAIVID